jgi:hypothetical protein
MANAICSFVNRFLDARTSLPEAESSQNFYLSVGSVSGEPVKPEKLSCFAEVRQVCRFIQIVFSAGADGNDFFQSMSSL